MGSHIICVISANCAQGLRDHIAPPHRMT